MAPYLQWEPVSSFNTHFINFFSPSLLEQAKQAALLTFNRAINSSNFLLLVLSCFIFSRCSASASMVVHPHHILWIESFFRSNLRASDRVRFSSAFFERARSIHSHVVVVRFVRFAGALVLVSKFPSPNFSLFARPKECTMRVVHSSPRPRRLANKWKFVIQMFPLFRCLLFRSPLYNVFKLSVSDVKVSQKESNGEKVTFLWAGL